MKKPLLAERLILNRDHRSNLESRSLISCIAEPVNWKIRFSRTAELCLWITRSPDRGQVMTKPFFSISLDDPRLALIPDQPGWATRSLGTVARYPTIQRSPEQRSPDRRASLLRRRQHAATGPLPPNLAANFTTGELAALKIVADECLAHGACDLSKNEIGARAGVCKTVVKRALKHAEVELTMISVQRRARSGRKHLTSIIRIIRAEWLTWLDRGNRKAYAIKACNQAKPDFKRFRGARLDPPRAQDLRNAGTDRVDRTVEKGNRTGASRA